MEPWEREKEADLVGRSLYMATSRDQMAQKATVSKAGGSNIELTHTSMLNPNCFLARRHIYVRQQSMSKQIRVQLPDMITWCC